MPLFTTITAHDLTLRVRLPESTREVLEYRAFIAPRLIAAHKSDDHAGLTQAVEWVISWLSRYCEQDEEWLDLTFSVWEMHALCLEVIDRACIPQKTAEEVEAWSRMMGEGGCQCKICEDPEKARTWDEVTYQNALKGCKWVEVSLEAQEMIGCVHSLQGSDMLHAPWYLYHARERYEIGLAMGRRAKQKTEEKREKFLQGLEEAGLRTPRKRR
jgi:hypothetical protein